MEKDVVRFKAEHYFQLNEQEATSYVNGFMTEKSIKALEGNEHSYSIFIGGRLIACAGLIQFWNGRAEAWAMIDKDCRKEFMTLHNVVKRFLEVCPVKRVEAVVDHGFEAGHKWVSLLGFKLEAPYMKAYGLKGGDCSLYARVR